jgi:NADH-quinone oxidoreductase subunit J
LPGPGVFATRNAIGTPALLPDGSIATESLPSTMQPPPAERPVLTPGDTL